MCGSAVGITSILQGPSQALQNQQWNGRAGQLLGYPQLSQAIATHSTGKVGTMSYIKEYFVKHRELLMGLVVIALIDHYFFKNALKERLQKLAHNILDQADKKLTEVK